MNNTILELSTRLERLETRAAILDLGARYSLGIDRRELPVFMSIWHDDAEYIVGKTHGRFKGLSELSKVIDFVAESYTSTHHWTTNFVLSEITDDRVSALSDSFAICIDEADKPHLVAATYDDVYIREADTWKIRTRVVKRWFVSEQLDVALTRPPIPL